MELTSRLNEKGGVYLPALSDPRLEITMSEPAGQDNSDDEAVES